MQSNEVIQFIRNWLLSYSEQSGTKGFIIGISGGVDSAVTSTLCAQTGKTVICLNMPIHQSEAEYKRGHEHIEWLKTQFPNVRSIEVELTETFETIRKALPKDTAEHWLSMANTRSRIRMTTLYAIGQANGLLVAGTGNKIEDFGVGFFTKYGDGGVDLSPIADLKKTEVFQIGHQLGIVRSILSAKPTDGLWEDGRSDEDQIGATYPELEWAMDYVAEKNPEANSLSYLDVTGLNDRHVRVLEIYLRLHKINQHKMRSIPVCIIPVALKQA